MRALKAKLLVPPTLILVALTALPSVAAPPAERMPMKEYMIHVIGYAAGNVWRWQGWSTDAGGEISHFPKTEAEWDEAESAALTLVELSDGLIARPDRKNRREWRRTAIEMQNAAQEAADTALYRDPDKFFAAGARLYDSCSGCHRLFIKRKGPPRPAQR